MDRHSIPLSPHPFSLPPSCYNYLIICTYHCNLGNKFRPKFYTWGPCKREARGDLGRRSGGRGRSDWQVMKDRVLGASFVPLFLGSTSTFSQLCCPSTPRVRWHLPLPPLRPCWVSPSSLPRLSQGPLFLLMLLCERASFQRKSEAVPPLLQTSTPHLDHGFLLP